jgi:hypothetical protein
VRHELDLFLKLLLLLNAALLGFLDLVALIYYHGFQLFDFVCELFNIGVPLRNLAEEGLLLLEQILDLAVLTLVSVFEEGSKLIRPFVLEKNLFGYG